MKDSMKNISSVIDSKSGLITLSPILFEETGIHNLKFRIYDSLGTGGKYSATTLSYSYTVRNNKPEWKIPPNVNPFKNI